MSLKICGNKKTALPLSQEAPFCRQAVLQYLKLAASVALRPAPTPA